MANFTLQDITGSAVAVAAFAIVVCAPGYVVAHVGDLFGFRGKGLGERLLWAVVCSFGVMPIACYFLGKYAGLGVTCWVVISLGLLWLGLLVREWLSGRFRWGVSRRTRSLTILLLVAWTAFAILSLVDVQIGNKLYFSVVLFDQSYRVAFTDAVMRGGVPPANPLYFGGHLQPLRYYYFWYAICAVVERIAQVSSRQAFIASSVWAGLGLAATIALYTRYFFGVVKEVRRQTWLTVALLAVTGADLVPAVGSLFAQKALNGEMEWWSNDQISSWMDSLLWVPHHTAALLCCLLSFLLLWRTREPLSGRDRALAVGLAGVAFASAFGLSIYVAFGFALLMLAWAMRLLLLKPRQAQLCGRIAAAGALSLVLLAPFLREMLAASGPEHGSGTAHVFAFSVRRMIDPELLTSLPVFGAWHRAHPVLLDQGMRVLLLLPGLALELGFYGAALVLLLVVWRRHRERLDEAHRTALYLAVCGLGMVVIVRSSVISNNDFGYRASMLPQFFLLILGASLLAGWWIAGREVIVVATPIRRRIVYGLLVLGTAGTIYQAAMLRMFLPIEETQPANGFAFLPAAAFQARRAFDTLDRTIPAAAVVEFNPLDPTTDRRGDVVTPYTFFTRVLLEDSDRQILSAEPECATEFGGDAQPCAAIQRATARLYASPAPPANWAVVEYCRRFGVGYLVATRLDPGWSDPAGWAATLPVVAAEPDIRVVACGSSDRPLETPPHE